MFDSLAEQIKKDEQGTQNSTQRVLIWAIALAGVFVLFGGVYVATRLIR